MKRKDVRRVTAALAAIVLATGGLGQSRKAFAQTEVTERPIGEFVDGQGTFDLGILFVPPVPNFLGTDDPEAGLSMSVDYAGLADATCDGIAGTWFDGTVKEKILPDGRAEVNVELLTYNAISWVVVGSVYANDPVVFGTRWEEVTKGKDKGDCVFNGPLALGYSCLKVTLINPEPGYPLPDLIQLLVFPEEGQELLSFSLHAVAFGQLPDGTFATAETHQVAKVQDGDFPFFVENIFIEPLE